jgi:diaminohydroxyphosphoribosylaminopyrimidine deaminase / 5-amino-6-(5-phosphoribosylamino)uracil reductase
LNLAPVDRDLLDAAFRLAERGRAGASPNPMVGAVIAKDGKVVGSGWHRKAGEPHAEVHALRAAGEAARGATLYVTLEPCSHHGRTGPCADAVVASGVRRVVAGATDVNPAISGEGFRRIEQAGIEVVRDAWPERDARLNETFRTFVTRGRPFVTLKMATSLDGKTATSAGHSRWISGEGSRATVQLLREEHDALAVGIGTVMQDDPRLSRRLGWRSDPPLLRVVFDRTLRLPLHARLFRDPSPVLVVTMEPPDPVMARGLERRGVEVMPVADGAAGLTDALIRLARRGISSILLEGGPALAASFVAAGLVDRWTGFVAPMLVGGDHSPGPIGGAGIADLDLAPRLGALEVDRIGRDVVLSGRLG